VVRPDQHTPVDAPDGRFCLAHSALLSCLTSGCLTVGSGLVRTRCLASDTLHQGPPRHRSQRLLRRPRRRDKGTIRPSLAAGSCVAPRYALSTTPPRCANRFRFWNVLHKLSHSSAAMHAGKSNPNRSCTFRRAPERSGRTATGRHRAMWRGRRTLGTSRGRMRRRQRRPFWRQQPQCTLRVPGQPYQRGLASCPPLRGSCRGSARSCGCRSPGTSRTDRRRRTSGRRSRKRPPSRGRLSPVAVQPMWLALTSIRDSMNPPRFRALLPEAACRSVSSAARVTRFSATDMARSFWSCVAKSA